MNPRNAEVVETLSTYFDGLYHSETARLEKAFRAQALRIGDFLSTCEWMSASGPWTSARLPPVAARREGMRLSP